MDKPAAFNVLSWNCRGIRGNSPEFLAYLSLSTRNIDVICLQETLLYKDTKLEIPGYTCYCKNRPEAKTGGGLAIAVSNRIKHHSYRDEGNNPEAQSVVIELAFRLVVTNIYVKPYHAASQLTPLLNTNFSNLLSDHPNSITVGDFNSHNVNWGCRTSSTWGKKLEEILDSNNLRNLNTFYPTHLDGNGSSSNIDLVIAPEPFADSCNCTITNNYLGSDHAVILTSVNIEPAVTPHTQNRFNLSKVDWRRYGEVASYFILDCEVNTSAEDLANRMVAGLSDAAKLCIPVIRPSSRSRNKSVPWWNTNCTEAVNRKKQALLRFQNSGKQNAHLLMYKRECTRCRRVLRNSKLLHWREFVAELDHRRDSKVFWTKVAAINGHKRVFQNIIINDDKEGTITDDFTIANCFVKQFFNKRNGRERLTPNDDNYPLVLTPLPHACESLNMPFRYYELTTALNSCKTSATGQDNISYEMMKSLSEPATIHLLNMFNVIWSQGIWPSAWKTAIVKPILKPGKKPDKLVSYRPIALNSQVGKVYERLINNRLSWYLVVNNIIPTYQTGFQKGLGTQYNLLTLTTSIVRGFSQHKHTGAIFVDLTAAFDNVDHDILIHKLAVIGLKDNIFETIKSFLTNRKYRVSVNSVVSDEIVSALGVPQGSVLSPILFIILLFNLLSSVTGIEFSMYADDLVFWFADREVEVIERALNEELKHVCNFFESHGLTISISKTKAMLFSRTPRKKLPALTVGLKGVNVEVVDSCKFLGVILDQRLSYDKHVGECVGKFRNVKNLLRKVGSYGWGANQSSRMAIYNSLALPYLDYANVWAGSLTKCMSDKLSKAQTDCLKVACRCLPSTNNRNVMIVANQMPLDIRVGRNWAIFAINNVHRVGVKTIFFGDSHDRDTKLVSLANIYLAKLPDTVQHSAPERDPFWTLDLPKVDTTLARTLKGVESELIQRALSLEHMSKFSDADVRIYTDGSKRNGEVASAFYILNNSYCERRVFKAPHSVYTAELQALVDAAKWTLRRLRERAESTSDFKVAIFTDSLSAATALARIYNHADNFLIRLFHVINTNIVALSGEITVIWIKAHCGLGGNEIVDKIAKGITKPHKITTSAMPLTQSDIHCKIRGLAIREWEKLYLSEAAYDKIKLFIPHPRDVANRPTDSLLRTKQYNRIVTGTTVSYPYDNILKRKQICQCGSTIDSVHIFTCEILAADLQPLKQACREAKVIFSPANIVASENLLAILVNVLNDKGWEI